MKKCLIIDEMHPSIVSMLKQIGVEPDYRPDITKQEVSGIIKDYYGLVVRSKMKITKELIDQASQLRFIARAGAGLDNIDVKK